VDDLRADVSAALTAAGIVHAVDPRGLQPPGVLVGPASGRMETGHRWATATLTIKVVERPPGDLDALTGAWATVTKILDALWAYAESWEPGPVPWGDGELPGYRITVSAPITGGTCP
jgi:hypothetical protein